MRHTKVGLIDVVDGVATPGVTIIIPLFGTGVYLIGLNSEVLHQWATNLPPGNYARLLPNGNLFWSGETSEGPRPAVGKGGLIREFDWDGNILWEYIIHGLENIIQLVHLMLSSGLIDMM